MQIYRATRIAGKIAYLTAYIINMSWMNNNHLVIFYEYNFSYNMIVYDIFLTTVSDIRMFFSF